MEARPSSRWPDAEPLQPLERALVGSSELLKDKAAIVVRGAKERRPRSRGRRGLARMSPSLAGICSTPPRRGLQLQVSSTDRQFLF